MHLLSKLIGLVKITTHVGTKKLICLREMQRKIFENINVSDDCCCTALKKIFNCSLRRNFYVRFSSCYYSKFVFSYRSDIHSN